MPVTAWGTNGNFAPPVTVNGFVTEASGGGNGYDVWVCRHAVEYAFACETILSRWVRDIAPVEAGGI